MQKELSTAAPGVTVGMRVAKPGFLGTWPSRLVALTVVGALVAGAVVVQRAAATPPKADLRTAPVARGTITQTVAVSGSVNAAATWRLNFKTAGRLAEILVAVGQQVTAGQTLAKLEVTDLQIALRQAQANLASAQAKYDQVVAGATAEDVAIAKQSVDNAKKSLDQASAQASSDVVAAKQSLDKLKTGYASAESTFTTLSTAVKPDALSLQPNIDGARNQLASVTNEVSISNATDANSARNSLNAADGSLVVAQSYVTSQLVPALSDYTSARDGLAAAVASFDAAIARGTDNSGATAGYQAALATYTTTATRLSSALDAAASPLNSAQTQISAAQTSLNTATSRADTRLDQPRKELVDLQSLITTQTQLVATLKSRLTQITSGLSTLSDAINGGYVSSLQSYAAAQTKSGSSIQSAQNTLDSAVLSLAKTSAPPKSFDVATAYASVLSSQTAVDTANNNLANAVLVAPAAGTVAAVGAQIGEMVAGGGTNNAFITIVNTQSLILHGTVGEADVAKLKIGQVGPVTVDAVGASSRMTGKVTSLDPAGTIQQGVPVYGIDVTIDLPNPQVRPGMSATASVILANRQDVLVVPNLAIRSQGARRFVQVLRDGQPVDADVVFGLSNDTSTEVVSGLKEGDVVVLPQPRAAASGQPRQQGGGGFPGAGGGPVIVNR